MQHSSTFDLMIGNALITQIDVCADVVIERGDWHIDTVYADAIEIDGKRTKNSRDYVPIPESDPLYKNVFMHFLTKCRADIDERVARRAPAPLMISSTVSAGRTL